ncbi:MAG: LPP20 family lipoprotein [Thermodesulfobacteriota bacterium]
MRKYKTMIIVISLLLIFPVWGNAEEWQDLIEKMGSGSINWSKGLVVAKGIGAPPQQYYGKPQARPTALRAARLDAMRNILEVIQGVRIDSTTTVKNFATESDVITSKVEGMVQGAKVVKQEYMSDGTVEVIVEMSLYGGFSQLVLPAEIKQVDTVRSTAPEPRPESPAPAATSEVFTGLVIDARGLNTRPAMAPKIMDESGQEVYGSAYVSREFAVQQGMSGYAKDIDAARQNPRVTNNPLMVKGLKTEGPGGSDVIISNADAAKLRSASENLSFLKKCRVMIVVD